jgi:hypothetical protein
MCSMCGRYRSDADSDVLADYVLALIRSDAPDQEIRKASLENLEDFLKDSSLCSIYFGFEFAGELVGRC